MRLIITILILVSASAYAQNITRLEYFFDTDPGFGNGTDLPISASSNLTQDFTVPLNTISAGIHNFYIRAKSNSGHWSIPVNKPVIVQYGSQSATVSVIESLEYFIDTDPGAGNGTSIPISSSTNITQSFAILFSGISTGFHVAYIRAKSNNGLWSHPFATPVFVQHNSQTGLSPTLKRIEYFIDTDPGFGNGKMVSASTTDVNSSILIDLSTVTPGFHFLYLRSQDINDQWSHPLTKPFFVEKSGSNIISLEYFFYDGITKTPIKEYSSFTPGKDIVVDFSAALSGLQPATSYEMHLQAIDENGHRSNIAIHTFTTPSLICDPLSPPTAANATRCGVGSVDLTASGASILQDYQWYTTATGSTAITGITGNKLTTPTLSTTTTYFVAIRNGTCESLRTPVIATIFNTPPKPNITSNEPINAGIVSICFNPVTLTAPNGFTSYLWSTGETTKQITTLQPGNYSVIVTDGNGCNSISSDIVQLINSTTCINNPPIITTTSLRTIIGGKVKINLTDLISDPDGNLDPTSLRLLSSTTNIGGKTLLNGFELEINYESIKFSGKDFIGIRVCDALGVCTEKTFEIDVVGDIVIYNGISPNGDSRNDTWYIENIELLPETKENKVSIYNRWGDLVWDGKNYDNTTVVFSGSNSNGNELVTGSYFYKIEFIGGRSTITGYLSLKR